QAEDGIRDWSVTGVQTCALPICVPVGKINPSSPYADWYTFIPGQADPDKQYKSWLNVESLPEVNKASPSFRAFIYGNKDGVMEQWLDRGAAGWRMDVAPWV